MQTALGPEKICEALYQYLSKVLTIKKFKLHDITYRKRLFTPDGIVHWYPLVRVKITYVVKKQLVTTTKVVYPSQIVRYVRKTLGLIKEMAYKKFVLNQSLFELENTYDKFGFGLKSILMELKRTTWAFNRFSTSGMVVGLDVGSWLKTEKRSFALLVKPYRKRFFPGKLFLSCPFRLKLIE
jgi:preprotein translocase subunit SecE